LQNVATIEVTTGCLSFKLVNEVNESIIVLRERKTSNETIRAMRHENRPTFIQSCQSIFTKRKAGQYTHRTVSTLELKSNGSST
jgi:uncharacterized protein YhaN